MEDLVLRHLVCQLHQEHERAATTHGTFKAQMDAINQLKAARKHLQAKVKTLEGAVVSVMLLSMASAALVAMQPSSIALSHSHCGPCTGWNDIVPCRLHRQQQPWKPLSVRTPRSCWLSGRSERKSRPSISRL